MGPFIIEEIIKQDSSMAVLHPQSINTIRILTFNIKGTIKILATSLRIGVGDSIADNAGSGGIFASIDSKTGIVVSKAKNYRGGEFITHPDSAVIIPGFRIPAWNVLIDKVIEISTTINEAPMLSWDFAYSEKGWVVVEVNTGGGWIILQAAQNQPLKKELYKCIEKLSSNE